ncbi:vitamin K epoxide reductase family protein [Mycolicibacterium mucogenicum]|uniref:Vitamin K epoxide reductase family protein n=1 Tax=Mycolicibacterium mucogenicum DSM 44124 TaxID=1226753 RepID=A0A8H2PGL7_MYCMU|nr:vitamin K epoxide reductase family protein [Mycolicibacterium mucogenicum]KAB7757938.1 membrane protein [Mycolicibacterium mucogenicum DSM 44124]QPG71371.1 vitamin K epoxide reductase family protein [Mycolicibacterium mucogenicum DSM 44124]
MTDVDTSERQAGVAVSRPAAVWILLAGIIGELAAFVLTVEKVRQLQNPSYVPSCSINPVLSCGSVMLTKQASLFGFPNPLLGIAAFSVVIVTGVLAVAGVRLPRWYWAGLAGGTLLGTVFVHWLIYQSLYEIGALCPYCMVVWVVTVALLIVVTSIALRPLAADNKVVNTLYQWRWPLYAVWITAIALLILDRFWSYWSTLI